jgi:hypothetical protein
LDSKSSWFKHSKIKFSRLWNTNCGISFWWLSSPVTGATEEYNGTSWATSPGSLNTARLTLAGAGTQTAALAFGGSPPVTGATEEYNGTSWTTSPASLATARSSLEGCGTQAAGLAFGGYITAVTAATEEWTGAGAGVTKTITVS